MEALSRLEECRMLLKKIELMNRELENIGKGEVESVIAEKCTEEKKALGLLFSRQLNECMRIINGLEGVKRTVLWRFYIYGQSTNQIAVSLHYSERYVKKIKKNALDALKKKEKGE